MEEEPKKISFGFSKVSKKNNIIQPKIINDEKKDIQFIKCLEEKSIKLVTGEEEAKNELPIIPMRNGNLLRESIQKVIKSREQNKETETNADDISSIDKSNEVQKESLTLDKLAAKEILEDLKKNENKKLENQEHAVPISNQIKVNEIESSTLEDYESMPISDFGLAMLRGMGWDPKKGIGLNEKIVTVLAPTVRPKGMGLGADKRPTSKAVSSNGKLLIMKKGAPIKIISGLHNNLYGKIEGFDELPGRIMVRLATNNDIVSINEIMVELVSVSEYNQQVKHSENRLIGKPGSSDKEYGNNVKSNKKRLNDAEVYEYVDHTERREIKEGKSSVKESVKKKYEMKNRNEEEKYEPEIQNYITNKKKKEAKRQRSNSSERISSYKHHRASAEIKKYHKPRSKESYREDYKDNRYVSSSSIDHNRTKKKKSNRHRTYVSSSSSHSDEDKSSRWNHRRSASNVDGKRVSATYEKVKHARKHKYK